MKRFLFKENTNRQMRGKNIETTAQYLVKETREKTIKVNSDTQHRIDIHTTIYGLVQEGYRKEAILNELYKKFPDSNYKEYFSRWVEDKIERSKKVTKNKDERSI